MQSPVSTLNPCASEKPLAPDPASDLPRPLESRPPDRKSGPVDRARAKTRRSYQLPTPTPLSGNDNKILPENPANDLPSDRVGYMAAPLS